MATLIDIGHITSLLIKVPARGEINWAQDFKTQFADKIADHDHTSGKGAKIKNAALVTTDLVGTTVTDVNGNSTAYTASDVAVSTNTIQDAAVTTAKIADEAITNAKIGPDAVDGSKIADNSITSDHIAPDTVIAADVATNAITEDELRDDASDDSLRAVSTNHIKDANVTTAKIADASITTSKIADANVTTAKIADSNITTSKIADYNVTMDKIADANVTAAKIADGNVTASKIGSNVVLSTLNDVSSLTPNNGEALVYSLSGGGWFPTALGAATGVIDTISNQTEASAYSGSAKFVNITSSVTISDITFDNRIFNLVGNITVTFQGCQFKKCDIRGNPDSASTGEIIIQNNTGTGAYALLHASSIITTGTVKLKDINSSSTGFFESSNRIVAEDIELHPQYRDFVVQKSTYQCERFRSEKAYNFKTEINDGANVTCGNADGKFKVLSGKIEATGGLKLSTSGNITVEGNAGYGFYNANSSYSYPMTITRDGIHTKAVVIATQGLLTGQAFGGTCPFDSEDDVTGAFNTSTDIFTAKVAGYYRASAYVSLSSVTSTSDVTVSIKYNTTTNVAQTNPLDKNGGRKSNMSGAVFLNIGDTLLVDISTNDSNYNLSQARFSVEKING